MLDDTNDTFRNAQRAIAQARRFRKTLHVQAALGRLIRQRAERIVRDILRVVLARHRSGGRRSEPS